MGFFISFNEIVNDLISGTVHRDHLPGFWALLQEILLEPAFAEEDLERIRSNAIAALLEDLKHRTA